MTKLNFKSNETADASIFKGYPIVWWTNLILIALLMFSLWGWFIQQNESGKVILEFVNGSPWLAFIIGSVAIVVLVIAGIVFLLKKTNA